MLDGLAAFFSRIDDYSEAFAEAFLREVGCDQGEMAEQVFVRGGGLRERVDVFFGDDEKVRGRLGMDVGEGDGNVVFEDFGGGNFSGNNPTK